MHARDARCGTVHAGHLLSEAGAKSVHRHGSDVEALGHSAAVGTRCASLQFNTAQSCTKSCPLVWCATIIKETAGSGAVTTHSLQMSLAGPHEAVQSLQCTVRNACRISNFVVRKRSLMGQMHRTILTFASSKQSFCGRLSLFMVTGHHRHM